VSAVLPSIKDGDKVSSQKIDNIVINKVVTNLQKKAEAKNA
jgi:hypothetical protein